MTRMKLNVCPALQFVVLLCFSRRSIASIYQSTGSLHSDGHSSNSMSPAPSPSPTHHPHGARQPHHPHRPHGRASTAPLRTPPTALRDGIVMPPPPSTHQQTPNGTPQRPTGLSGSMSNLSLSGSRKWNSTSDFRDQSPGPGAMARFVKVIIHHRLN